MATGRKTGGRQKNTPNKKTKELQEAVAASGITPLDYMLQVLRDENADEARRDDMARAAAPYIHARLSAVEVGGRGGGPIEGKISIVLVDPVKKK